MPTTRTITVDPAVGTCHISLSDRPVASTEEFSDNILVDLDEFGVAVGIEVLDLGVELPLTDLRRQLHIHEDDEPRLARLLPALRYSPRFTLASSPDPTIRARTATANHPPLTRAT